MTSLSKLIERCERANGPDRELDHFIWALEHDYEPYWEDNKLLARSRKAPSPVCRLGTIDPGRVQRNFVGSNGFKPPIPFYTASLDAAVSLVETMLPEHQVSSANFTRQYIRDEGWQGGRPWAAIWTPDNRDTWREEAATQPLAIILALLRSLQSQGREA